MSDIQDLIQHALNQDYNKANEVFGDLMGDKIGNALEQQKADIASQIYNGGAPEEDIDEEDIDIDDEELDELVDEIDEDDTEIEED